MAQLTLGVQYADMSCLMLHELQTDWRASLKSMVKLKPLPPHKTWTWCETLPGWAMGSERWS